ncbi:MAG: AAA family ATPase [Firmicutes bacterium]|jgi:cellulose biosynthesis protein BcsQ|nr:AAA family ATPase [Bacillota bacterium]
MKTIVFFNNKGGVGKTSLVYHLAWMYAALGLSVVAVDLDPQSNLTSMFLDEDRLGELVPENKHDNTIYGAVQPLFEGTSDIASPHIENIDINLGLILGDLAMSASEDELTSQWPACLDKKPRAFRVISALWRAVKLAVDEQKAQIALIDVGPNLGALNRASLIAAQNVVIPLAPDLYSLQGLRNLGPTLKRWREEWKDRRIRNPVPDLELPTGEMEPVGYVIMQHAVREDRPVKAYERWIKRIPEVYREVVVEKDSEEKSYELATLKHYRSLMALAQEARKPMFLLTAADGAIGGHAKAVRDCYDDFHKLASTIASKCGVEIK